MMVLFRSALLCALLAQSASAQTILCKMDPQANKFYIAPEISLTVGDFGEVAVRDAIISSTGRKMVAGKVSKDDARRFSATWELKNVPADPAESRAYEPQFAVRLSIQKSNGAASITMADLLFRDFFYRSTGVCRFTD